MIARIGVILLTGGLLAACVTPVPARPAMAPYGVNGHFGYTERDLGDGLRQVEYVGAAIRVAASTAGADSRIGPEQDKVRDLALWRAAEIALESGNPGFRVERETRDNDYLVREEIVPRPFWFPYHGYYSPYYRRPWWFYDDYDGYDTRRYASLRARITLDVRLVPELSPADASILDAAAVKSEVTERRANATY